MPLIDAAASARDIKSVIEEPQKEGARRFYAAR